MSNNLLQKLKEWRKVKAEKDDVSAFMILHNSHIEQIAKLRPDRKSTRLNSSHTDISRMPSSA